MKAIMISIQPKWCELIANGKKTGEVRKTRPKLDPPFKCYIYCTKASKKYQTICGCMVLNSDELYRHPTQGIKHGDSIELMLWDDTSKDNFLNGKVIGEFVCDNISKYSAEFVEGDFDEYIRYCYDNIDGEEERMIVATNDSGEFNTCFLFRETCLTFNEIKQYVGVNFHDKPFYVWHISDLVVYDKPKELGNFIKCEYPCDCCACDFWDSTYLNCGKTARPPQSWCYVEEIKP